MIKTKEDLKNFIHYENQIYQNGSLKNKIIMKLMKEQKTYVNKYLKYLRKTEYYMNMKKCPIYIYIYRNIMFWYYRRKKNKFGIKIGIEIYENCFDKGLTIYHTGIVVNRNAKIGKNCKLHGSNCIGNDGKDNGKCPKIGDNVSLGFGATIIGDVYIANNIKIGAGAVVTKSFYEEGITIAGIPARKI